MRMTEEEFAAYQRKSKRKTAEHGEMSCVTCGVTVKRTSALQKYCETCRDEISLARKRKWAQDHPIDKQKSGEKARAATARAKSQGMEVNKNHVQSIAWDTSDPELLWTVRLAIPFDYAISKNRIWSTNRKGTVFLRKEHRDYRDNVVEMFVKALKNAPIVQHKIWLDILVQKPNHRGDAINVVDGLCDAIKVAAGVDDRWFSIRKLDWEIVKENPQIYIGIGQTHSVDSQVCSLCGQILPFTDFTKSKHNKNGIARECPDCRKVIRKGSRWLKKDADQNKG